MAEMIFPAKIEPLLKKFSKIYKKSVSQSILEVGHFTSVKNDVFQNLDILYRKSYSKFDGFWWLSINLVVFLQIHWNVWSVQLLESIVRRIFYRFWKTFFQSDCIFAGKSISAVYNAPTSPCVPASARDRFRTESVTGLIWLGIRPLNREAT